MSPAQFKVLLMQALDDMRVQAPIRVCGLTHAEAEGFDVIGTFGHHIVTEIY